MDFKRVAIVNSLPLRRFLSNRNRANCEEPPALSGVAGLKTGGIQMKRNLYVSAALITSLTACKPTTVVVNNTVTAAPGTTANVSVNESGVNNNLTSSGVINTEVNTTAVNGEQPPEPGNTTNY
jgi:hypothetical protein